MAPMTSTGADLTPGARRILQTASELFYRRGIHAVGVDRIAAESGVTKRTLYDRFGSKDALVVAYLRGRHEQWWGRLQDRLADADAPRVLAVVEAYAHDPLPVDRGCGFLNAAAELPSDHVGLDVVREHKRAVRDLLEWLLREDGLGGDDPAALAEHVFLLLEGGVAHRGVDPRVQERAGELVRALVEPTG